MYENYYNRFLNKINNKALASVLARILTIMIYIIYLIKRVLCVGSIKANYIESRKHVESISPKPREKYVLNKRNISNNIDLSIVVPAYNVEDYIDNCLKSIIKQDTKYNIEVIVINDGSTDKTYERICKYNDDKRIKIINQKNKGFSGARNVGIDTACGKYIMFVDSDDLLLDNSIDRLLDVAFKYDVDVVQGGYEYFNNEKTISKISYKSMSEKGDLKADMSKLPGFPWGKVYKNCLFNKVRFPLNYWFEDTVIHFIIFRIAKSYMTINDIVYGYRYNPKGITANYDKYKKCIDTYWVVEELINIAHEIGIKDEEYFYKFFLFQISAMTYSRINKLDEGVIKDIFVLICNIHSKYKSKSNKSKLSLIERDIKKSLETYNYKLWKLASQYM